MRAGLAAGLAVNAMVLVAMMPWTNVVSGEHHENPYWLLDWYGTRWHSDTHEGSWTTGATFTEVFYSAGQGDQNGFNRYIAEMTIPWFGIQMTGGNMIYYEYSDETTEYHFYCDPDNIIIHQYSEQNPCEPWFSVEITYILDSDGDSDIDWEVIEYIRVDAPGQNQAMIRLEYTIGQIFPPGWNNVQIIEIPLRVDADVYDRDINDFYFNNPHTHVTMETFINAAPRIAEVWRTDIEPTRIMKINPNPAVNPTSQFFYFVNEHGAGEFSQHPSIYLNNKNLDDDNGAIWYVETFQVNNGQGNVPPTIGNAQWNGIFCNNFQA